MALPPPPTDSPRRASKSGLTVALAVVLVVVVVLGGLSLVVFGTDRLFNRVTDEVPSGVDDAVVTSGQRVTDIHSFVAALGAAGYNVREGPSVIPPGYEGFARRATRITVDTSTVWAFEFPTASGYKKMRSRISKDGQRIGDATFVWTPHLCGAGRLIVLVRRQPADKHARRA
jgi:hypothetical protein